LRRAALVFQGQLKLVMAELGYEITQGYNHKASPNCTYKATATAGAAGRGLSIKKLVSPPKFTAFFVNSVLVKASQDGAAQLQISDGLGNVFFTKDLTLKAYAVQEVMVLQEFALDAFYITLEGAPPAVFDTVCSKADVGCCGQNLAREYYTITGFDGLQVLPNSFGLVLNGGVQCSFGQVVCAILPYVAEAMLNLCHAIILQDILSSTRLNYTTLYADADAIKGRISQLNASAKKAILAQIGTLLPTLKSASPVCISCNKQTAPYLQSRV